MLLDTCGVQMGCVSPRCPIGCLGTFDSSHLAFTYRCRG